MSSPIVRCAHRGASVDCPENTLLAFNRAIEMGVDALELDLHLSRDNALVVIHDSTLDRTTNGFGLVAHHSLADIRKLDAGQGQKVPILSEVFDLVRNNSLRLCLEIKGHTEAAELATATALVQAVEDADLIGRCILTSFSKAALLRVRALQPALSLMLDPSPQNGTLTPRQICAQTLRAGANIVSFEGQYVTPELAKECRLVGLILWAWTPTSPEQMREMINLGVQGLVTDQPDILNKVLHDSPI
jgi:glycerophosphoryl diester phosphodiesterase